MIVIVDWQEKQGSLERCQNVQGLNVLKETPGKNVGTFRHVQVTINFPKSIFGPYDAPHLIFQMIELINSAPVETFLLKQEHCHTILRHFRLLDKMV